MEDFSSVRRTPQGREAIFTPAILIEREFSESKLEDRVKSQKRVENVSDIISKFTFPGENSTSIENTMNIVRHSDDMNLYVLAISSFLFNRFSDPNKITPNSIEEMRQFVNFVPRDNSKKNYVAGTNYTYTEQNKILADVLAYYYIIYQSDRRQRV